MYYIVIIIISSETLFAIQRRVWGVQNLEKEDYSLRQHRSPSEMGHVSLHIPFKLILYSHHVHLSSFTWPWADTGPVSRFCDLEWGKIDVVFPVPTFPSCMVGAHKAA